MFDTGPDDKVSVNDGDDFVIWWFGAGVNGDGRDLRRSGGGGGVYKGSTFFIYKGTHIFRSKILSGSS